jgi:hypothetical protein
MLLDFNTNVGREDILKSTIGNVSLHEINDDNGVVVVNFEEEQKLRVFENRVLRRMFGLKRDEVKGGWRYLQNEELHNLYSSQSDKVKECEMSRACSMNGEKRNMYKLVDGKQKERDCEEGKAQVGG